MFSFTIYKLLQNFTPYDGAPPCRQSTKKERQATEKFSFGRPCSLHFVSAEVYRCHKTLLLFFVVVVCFFFLLFFFVLNVFLFERRNFVDNKISI